MARHKGEFLNEHYGRGAKQARYRENGVWYHLLTQFPADLYDANGVIRFNSDSDYRRYIHIGPEPNSTHARLVGDGISDIPGYKKLKPARSELL